MTTDPCVTMQPTISDGAKEEMSIYPACAVTRAMARKEAVKDGTVTSPLATMIAEESSPMTKGSREALGCFEGKDTLSETLFICKPEVFRSQGSEVQAQHLDTAPKSLLISSQENDPTLSGVRERIVSESEAAGTLVCY